VFALGFKEAGADGARDNRVDLARLLDHVQQEFLLDAARQRRTVEEFEVPSLGQAAAGNMAIN
jgi:hypothetical protein